MKKSNLKRSYHHGNLRQTLLDSATKTICEKGVEHLTLRKLATGVGVSGTAVYHHFGNKSELLCAIATEGFKLCHQQQEDIFSDESLSLRDRFRLCYWNYVAFAYNNSELYELMFGRTIWKQKTFTPELRSTSSKFFSSNTERIALWQKEGVLSSDENTLRLSQVVWASKHGMAKLLTDGIYTKTSTVESICDTASDLFMSDP